MNIILSIFALESAADGYLTFQLYRFGGHEAWIPKVLFDITGVYWGLMILKIGAVAWEWYAATHGGSLTALGIMEVGYAGVIVFNWMQLQKHKAGA